MFFKIKLSQLVIAAALTCTITNALHADMWGNIADTVKKAGGDVAGETHRAIKGIEVATKIAGKDVSREFWDAVPNSIDYWHQFYDGVIPDTKVRQILNSTAALAAIYYMPSSAWLILIERKISNAALIERKKREAKSQTEIDSLSAAETSIQDNEDTSVLIDEPSAKVDYQVRMDQITNELTACISAAGDNRKAQLKCQVIYKNAATIATSEAAE